MLVVSGAVALPYGTPTCKAHGPLALLFRHGLAEGFGDGGEQEAIEF
jgi:hypothetical protein